jgi:predicted Rdx family selenoprotein
MNRQIDRFRSLSRTSRTTFWVILAGMVALLLFAIFSTRLGQYALLCCCGGAIAIVVVGLLSERGMSRR